MSVITGDCCRALRNSKGLTLSEMGAQMGVSPQRVSQLEALPAVDDAEWLRFLEAILAAEAARTLRHTEAPA